MVMSISSVPKFGRRKRSVIFSASVYGLPLTSSQPALLVAAEVRRLDDQRVALPPAARVAEPPRRRVVVRRRPAIHVDVAQTVVRLVGDQHQVLGLDDLPRLRMVVVLHQADRQAPHVRVVLAVVGHPLLLQLSGPWLERQRVSAAGDFAELSRAGCRPASSVGGGGAPAARPRPPPPPPARIQMPEKSTLPSAVRGVGASRFGLPSAVRGTPVSDTTATARPAWRQGQENGKHSGNPQSSSQQI